VYARWQHFNLLVTPAEAGAQASEFWMPASAGMTSPIGSKYQGWLTSAFPDS